MNYAEVFLWGTRVGILHLPEGSAFAQFEYDHDFAEGAKAAGIELSPIKMPISDRVYSFPDIGGAFKGVPGLVADSLPDKFGNAVINQWLARQGKTESDFNVIDRLCYTGSRGMGALEYVPAQGPKADSNDIVDVDEMVRFASEVLASRESVRIDASADLTYSQLLKLGTSAGGARAKAIVAWNENTGEIRSGQINAGDDFSYWLIKFDGVSKNGDHDLEDEPEYTLIEYAYYRMALLSGIEMNECRIFSENGRNHFMTKRFDRIGKNKLHMQTLGAIAHIDYNIPALCSYEQAAGYMRQMKLTAAEIEQFYRRMVFNVMAVNQDDHVKNTSFLMDRRGKWRLSPAYDMTFSYNPANIWLKAHQMTINGKTSGISRSDLVQAGRVMDISNSRIDKTISEVSDAVSKWKEIAQEVGIREQTIKMIDDIIAGAQI